MIRLSPNLVEASCPTSVEPEEILHPETTLPWGTIWAILLSLVFVGSLVAKLVRPGQSIGLIIPILVFVVCLLGAGFDTAVSRIPNALTYTAILLGLGLNSIAGLAFRLGATHPARFLGTVGAGQAFSGFALTAGIGLICLMFSGMGGGDIKLMVAMGSLLGFSQISLVLPWTLLIAVPFALLNLIAFGRLNGLLRYVGLQLLRILYTQRFEPIDPPSKTFIPLAVPLLIALVCTRLLPHDVLWQWVGG